MGLDTLAPTGLRDGSFKRALSPMDAVSADATFRAWCFSDGVIFYGHETPSGAIELLHGGEAGVRKRLSVLARHGYVDGVLLVPGVPEAEDQSEAAKALAQWLDWCSRTDTFKGHVVWNRERRVAL